MPHWVTDSFYTEPKNSGDFANSVSDSERKFTGLLNSEGKRIYKEPNEIGFNARHNLYSYGN